MGEALLMRRGGAAQPSAACTALREMMADDEYQFYCHELSNDSQLVSCQIDGFGLWLLRPDSAKQVSTVSGNWLYCRQIEDGYLLGSDLAESGMLYYDPLTETAAVAYSGDNGWGYVSSSTGLDALCALPGGYLVGAAPSSTSSAGFLFYDSATHHATQVWSSSDNWIYYHPVPGGCLCSSSTSGTGLLYFDLGTKTATQLTATGRTWRDYYDFPDYCICSCNYTGTGLYCFDFTDRSFTKIVTSSYYWQFFHPVPGGLIIGSLGLNSGLIFLDAATRTFSVAFAASGNYNWRYFYDLPGGVLVGSMSSAGLLYYDNATRLATKVYGAGSGYQFRALKNGRALGSGERSSATSGLYVYDLSAQTVTKVYAAGYTWRFMSDVGDGFLCSSNKPGFGVVYYDATANTATQVYAGGSHWNKLTATAGGYYLEHDGVPAELNCIKLFWDSTAHTLTEVTA